MLSNDTVKYALKGLKIFQHRSPNSKFCYEFKYRLAVIPQYSTVGYYTFLRNITN